MAKTIKELAHQYVYEYCDNDKHAITMQCTYEAGANAVLNELEEFINSASFGDEIGGILSFIKELRSE